MGATAAPRPAEWVYCLACFCVDLLGAEGQRYPDRHQTLIVHANLALGPSGELLRQGEDVGTGWSGAANLRPRHTPAAAE